MATYSIRVLNNSGFTKNYVIFMETPIVTNKGANPKIYTNAWVTFSGVQPGGVDVVNYTDETSALWSRATTAVAPGTTVGQYGTVLVDTATQDSVTFVGGNQNTGFTNLAHGGAMTASYEIIANSDFDASAGYLFGLARPGNIPGIPSPVSTFLAEPNGTYNITPVEKFYIAEGVYTPGSIIDVSTTSTVNLGIDFTGKSQVAAVVTQASNGSFSVVYY